MNFNPLQPPALDAVIPGGGAIGERIRAFDWNRHPLGPPEHWPHSLKIVIRIMLTSRYAMWLGWGPELYFFYNDAYAPTLGIKEAWALGTPASHVWAEVWQSIATRAESVLRTGNATWDESLRLFLERSGYTEETYHTFSYSPVPDDDGSIGGLLCVVTEDTERVIGERRLALLRELGSDLSGTSTEERLFLALNLRLSARPHDVPFALVYVFDANGTVARLVCRHGVENDPAIAPETIPTKSPNLVWPAGEILGLTPSVLVGDLSQRFPQLSKGPWDKPPRQAVVVPIAQHGTERPAGFLVAGINPYRPLDSGYNGFLKLLAGQIAAGLSNVRAYEAERKRAEALAELDRAKTEFFANVSHELRTPLTLMLAPVEDLLSAPAVATSPDLRELAVVAQRNGLRLLKLVNTILDFSRIEAGRLQAVFEPTDLSHFTRELASSFRAAIERAGLRLVVDCAPLPEPVYVDREMWEKIVLNLISNAYKFTQRGEIRVTLQSVGDCVDFSVRDTGIGIPPEAKPHLFERFFRIRGPQVRTQEGTGIGLAMVHELVKLHGGTIHVDSEPGAGSTFTVFLRKGQEHLPAGAAASQPASPHATTISTFTDEASQWRAPMEAPATDEAPARRLDEGGGRVLVVDDNADLRQYVARILSAHYQVFTAADGAAALEIAQREKPDLVLSDVMMPKLDGFGLLRAIRSRPELATTPVILLSARAGEESRIEGLDAGADDYLAKPFSGRELLARVNVHLQMGRVRGEAEERERELRTRAEIFASALRESSERLSVSLAAAGTGTFRWDLRAATLDFDDSLNRLFGLGPEEKTRSLSAFLELIHAEDRDRVSFACDRCARTGSSFDLEFRINLPGGSTRWLEAKAQAFFDKTGRPSYMTGACVDITKRKQAETFVWRQKDVLEQIVQGAPLSDVLETLTLDIEHIAERKLVATLLLAANDGADLTFVAGRRCPPEWQRAIATLKIGEDEPSPGSAAHRRERVIAPDVMTAPGWDGLRQEAVKHGLRACWSTPILSSHGSVLGTVVIFHSEPTTPTEHEIRFVDIVTRTAALAIERDRSERALKQSQAELADHARLLEVRVRERTAELQETISELEAFSYSISHDMRAPLRAMQSFAQILAEEWGGQIGPEGKDYIRRIIGASDRMDRLIQDVLTYSRVTRTELTLEPINLEKLIDGILESYPQFHAARARIEVRRPLPWVMGNEAALIQCLSNLVGNAVKFVPPHIRPQVEIWAQTLDRRVRIYVRDNGIGIEPEAHEKIFHIFHQIDRSFEGTGIGLAVVRKAAERMGGSVGLKSELNRGSTFHLELNLARIA